MKNINTVSAIIGKKKGVNPEEVGADFKTRPTKFRKKPKTLATENRTPKAEETALNKHKQDLHVLTHEEGYRSHMETESVGIWNTNILKYEHELYGLYHDLMHLKGMNWKKKLERANTLQTRLKVLMELTNQLPAHMQVRRKKIGIERVNLNPNGSKPAKKVKQKHIPKWKAQNKKRLAKRDK